jgi:N-methylhydantoinase B
VTSKGAFIAPSGSLLTIDVPGSGGFGPPAERDRAALLEDVIDGYVSPESADRDYGGLDLA